MKIDKNFMQASISNITQVIERLDSINPNDEFAYEKAVSAFLSVRNLPVFIYDVPANEVLFRSRTHYNSDAPFFNRISDILITPAQYVRYFGRCNRPSQSKFYGSQNRPTSFMELVNSWAEGKSAGDKVLVTIGRWEIRIPLNAIIIASPDKDNRTSQYDIDHGEILDYYLDQHQGETKEAYELFFRYLTERFRTQGSTDPRTYFITSAYCNVALAHSQGQAVAISYPSVPFMGDGINYAINSSVVNPENFILTHAIRNELTIFDLPNGKFNFKETGIVEAKQIHYEKGEIIWA